MGSVIKRPNGRFRVQWREPDGTQRARSFATRKEADDYLATTSADLVRGEYISPNDSRTLFGVYATQWRKAQVHRDSTSERTELLIRIHMEVWEDRTLGSIRPTEVQAWVKRLADTMAPRTVGSVYQCFSTIMRSAVVDRLINESPCVRIQLPKVERTNVEPLPVDVVFGIAEKIRPEFRVAVMISAGAGLRISECCGLTVDRVDFLGRTITVDRQLLDRPGIGLSFGPPKTLASKRIIPVGDVVLEELAAHLARFGEGPDGVIVSADGKQVGRRRLGYNLRTTISDVEDCPPDTTWHDFRHFYASVLIAGGASVSAVQARLGHATAAETLDVYTHLFPAEDDSTRAVTDRALRTGVDSLLTKRASRN